MEIIIGILAEMNTLPSLQVTIFILHFEQLKYLNNYLSIRTLFKPWLYLSHFPSSQRLLFSWGPGSAGERLAEGSGVKVERGHYLLLQVRLLRSFETINILKPGGVQPWDGLPHR